MITFAPMPPLAARYHFFRRYRPVTTLSVMLASLVATPQAARAQSPLSHVEDASPVPAGSLRLRITTAWTRYDERFATAGGAQPLSADLSSPALGVAELPLLAPTEASLRTLAGDPSVRLSLGRLEVRGGARVVTTPISLEYGITRRLSVGVQVPIVQTRRVVQLRVNNDTAALANVGWLPGGKRVLAAEQNQAVWKAYNDAAIQLDALISQCSANPSGAGCGPVIANPAGAAAARDQARAYATAVKALGLDASAALLAPRASSPLDTAINVRRVAINGALQQFLGAGAGSSQSVFTASTNFSYLDLQGQNGSPGLLQSVLGGGLDSMHTADRLGVGDVAVGAQYLLFDRFARGAAPIPLLQSRMLVGAKVRFATSRADSAQDLVDIAPGEGAGVELHSALDLLSGRFGGTIAARYVKAFARTVTAPVYGDPESAYPFPVFAERVRTAGNVLGLDLTPRYYFSDWLSMDALYGLERVGATQYAAAEMASMPVPTCSDCQSVVPPEVMTTSGVATTAQRLGFGFRFSSTDAYARGRASFPIEVSFAHLETVSGNANLAKYSRDQIQIRLYYRLRRAD